MKESADISEKLLKQTKAISAVVDVLFNAWKKGKWVFVIGNGGSAGTATHFVGDLIKTTIEHPHEKGLRAIALADNVPMISAAVNDWGWHEAYTGILNTYWSKGSIVIAFSVHGGAGKDKAGAWSQNLLKALQFAKDNGGVAVGISGFDGGAMKDIADISVVVPAHSTPLVESYHVVLFHLITFRLKELIRNASGQKGKKRR
ncbi:MAG: D-sedoheptulose 7-phosphate isomerase [Parcubacteria group bacterium Greene0416_79]|nr:MAG: D-sedoheptulose 7-phosphate isomerase [Parcubacteria group bacterium Greene0416_79]